MPVMADVQKSLLQVVTSLRLDLIKSFALANRVASGKTESEIEATATDRSAQLTGPYYIYALQDGRKPTKEGAPAGDPTLFEQIKEWCQIKGIEPQYAYPITKKIHEEGYPGTPGLIDEPLSDDNINKYLNEALGDIANIFAQAVSEKLDTILEPITA